MVLTSLSRRPCMGRHMAERSTCRLAPTFKIQLPSLIWKTSMDSGSTAERRALRAARHLTISIASSAQIYRIWDATRNRSEARTQYEFGNPFLVSILDEPLRRFKSHPQIALVSFCRAGSQARRSLNCRVFAGIGDSPSPDGRLHRTRLCLKSGDAG